jgi:DNA-binding GntR family transcriptional regulator
MFKNDDRNGDYNLLLTAPSQRTLSDYVADQLRQAILAEQIKPNERLVEQEIAESMQTSRGPVRDALKILENEGLVVRQSHRGAFVAQLHSEDFMEIYTFREALETLAIEYAIQNASDQQIETLPELVRSMEKMSHEDYSQVEATDLDMEFHHTLCQISGHKRVLSVWESMGGQIRLVLLKHRLSHPDDLRERSVSWHSKIVEALRERNREEAIQELRTHMAASSEWVEKLLRQKNQRASIQ